MRSCLVNQMFPSQQQRTDNTQRVSAYVCSEYQSETPTLTRDGKFHSAWRYISLFVLPVTS